MTAIEDLIDGLHSARSSVFRLEGHQDYPDDELWQAYLRGELWDQDRDLSDWCALVSATVDRGVTWTRVRVVTEPWTPYTRWEIEQHFPHNLHAGEDIRVNRSAPPGVDFWLIDDERGWLLEYEPCGAMTVTPVSGRSVQNLRERRDHALRDAEPLAAAQS